VTGNFESECSERSRGIAAAGARGKFYGGGAEVGSTALDQAIVATVHIHPGDGEEDPALFGELIIVG
jgi:hypothetical protein